MNNENNTVDAEIVEDYMLGDQAFEDNVQKVPVQIALDVSGSMSGVAIKHLEQGLNYFWEALKNTPDALKSVELSVICYNHEIVSESNFCSVADFKVPSLNASGGTNTSAALNRALENVKNRKAYHKSEGNGLKQPWIVLISDGYGGDVTAVAEEIRLLKENRKLTFFSVGIGSDAPLGDMAKFGHVISLEESKNIGKFFEWLSASLDSVSGAVAGDGTNVTNPTNTYMKLIA